MRERQDVARNIFRAYCGDENLISEKDAAQEYQIAHDYSSKLITHLASRLKVGGAMHIFPQAPQFAKDVHSAYTDISHKAVEVDLISSILPRDLVDMIGGTEFVGKASMYTRKD